MARLWRCLPAFAAAAWLGLTAGGCSTSYQLGSLFGKDDDKPGYTNGISSAGRNADSSKYPSDADLALAKAAATDVLSRGGKDASAPWENPQTGARGTVTPIATAYSQDGALCRDFLASFVREGSESWLQGEACRQRGQWEVRKLTPWKRS
jgi:surface antigen